MSTTNYDRLIVGVLLEAGSNGLTSKKISRHVYNAVNELFEVADLVVIHRHVRSFLSRYSKGNGAALNKPKRGTYCLNRKTKSGKLLMEMKFGKADALKIPSKPDEDKSLYLFNDYDFQ